MNDKNKTKEQLLVEVAKLRSRVAELEKVESACNQAGEALRISEKKLQLIIDTSPVGICTVDPLGNYVTTNLAFEQMLGYPKEELRGLSFFEVTHPDDRPQNKKLFQDMISSKMGGFFLEKRYIRKDGTEVEVAVHASGIIDAGENARFGTVFVDDITERKQAEGILERTRMGLRQIIDLIPEMIWLKDADGRFLMVNQMNARTSYNMSVDEMTGRLHSEIHPDKDQVARMLSDDRRVIESGKPVFVPEESFVDADGVTRCLQTSKIPFTFAETGEQAILGIALDITERKRTEESLRKSEEGYQLMIDLSPDMTIVSNGEGLSEFISSQIEKVTGYSVDDFIGKGFPDIIHPDDMGIVQEKFQSVLVGTTINDLEYRIVDPDGEVRWMLHSAVPVLTDGENSQIYNTVRNITDRKRAEQEKTKLEDQFHQAQKMESVGRLAGGVAHDFNNLLTAIIGYSEMIESSLDSNDPLSGDVKGVLEAAYSATQLTAQLLAFSRKQTIDPKVIDIKKTVERSQKMLKRLIEEDIDLKFVSEKDLWKTKVDPGQLDQILVNLAVNARDAMPDGGRLTIETANVAFDEEYCNIHPTTKPGDFVMLAVSDNGTGMEKEVQDNIFEPFFTTKAKGEGTGLGLSTVYGIVKQHGGFIYAYSEPGEGSSFKIYLPRIDEEVQEIATPTTETLVTGTETVLLVEDNDLVRRLAKRILVRNGYRILESDSGSSGYLKCKKYEGDIHLLLTDVVMPGMNGNELYEQVASMKPGIKVLYMSGYTDDAIAHRGVLEEGVVFIQKPFKADNLLRNVREVLDAKPE
jgi:PAS domain S-box-containing protein